MKRKLLLSAVLHVCINSAFTQLPNKNIDVQHYRFAIELNDENNTIQGEAQVEVVFLNDAKDLAIDLVQQSKNGKGMLVTSVKTGEKELDFLQDSTHLVIKQTAAKNERKIFVIRYAGEPADGLIIGTNKYGHRTFFSDNWPNRAHNWIPCMDHPSDKATVEFIITAPQHYQVVSNGLQVEETNLPDQLKRTHWKEEVAISTKIFALGAADFAVNYTGNVNCIPVYSWLYPEEREKGFKVYGMAKDILPWYIKNAGPYAYEKLANIQSKTMFGGVENAGAIFYSEKSVGEAGIESLLAHEIAHQWFGDAASETDWPHLWLSEGFATYMTHLYLEDKYGADSLKKRMVIDRIEVIKLSRKRHTPVIDSSGITKPMGLLNANSYQKGGWVLHMLRRKLGNLLFWKSVRAYYAKYNGGNASTEDLRAVFEQQSGQNLGTFFKQWLYTAGQPQLAIQWKYNQTKKNVQIKLEQSQQNLFSFPLKLLLTDGSNTKTLTVEMNGRVKTVILPLNFMPAELVADPGVDLLFEAGITALK